MSSTNLSIDDNDESKTNDSGGLVQPYMNTWIPDFTCTWADPNYLQSESYQRVTEQKAEVARAQEARHDAYQAEVRSIAKANHGQGAGIRGEEGVNHAHSVAEVNLKNMDGASHTPAFRGFVWTINYRADESGWFIGWRSDQLEISLRENSIERMDGA